MPSLMNIFDVAGSALSAQSQRLNVTASNLANADSMTGPDGQPYKAKQVVFETDPQGGARTASGQGIGGVRVAKVIDDPSPMKSTYDPSNPQADANGYVQMPNVDPVQEMVNMISASRSYQANVETLNTAKSLMLKTLTIGT
ncbi:flagellar basal body rod protein FlgC [Burkholderia guangdongensis]|uniref:flagellar basal body rod protein FlgC n=1 Tax=Burkholderia guangdongensis TaxID=1792500 RepID=UPI0015CAA282|nr:flagellar basal body rod protein FlgC [Burkholderia guangdongensis]